ncbi:signal peptide peptidase SppA [Methanohalophilus euhalobius]|uniref:Signal peptide peptidase A n=1 Tax=Methanohalophilus euhalobius TaxID=51203 RepID=A0A314ZY02_9EURY|nr:signal peptide peptidase SppA [Methanohalophilus euhalobius]PQV42920.1 signal peptide peptidase A [Methanohalophilus euhalobius]RNI10412.1 signal peptide peptidase SppA [Methanohalophilus euhalobius]
MNENDPTNNEEGESLSGNERFLAGSDKSFYTELEDDPYEQPVQEQPVSGSPLLSPPDEPGKGRMDVPHTPPEKKSNFGKYAALIAVLFLIIGSSFAIIYYSAGGDFYPDNNRVAVIYIQGTMLTGSVPSGLGYATSENICASIRKAVDDDSVKAIVLRINSGGGSGSASEEINTEIRKAQQAGVPVVTSMGDVAASAAYHVSSSTDLIVANRNTMTGSIGVIWTFRNMSAYYEEEGIDYHVAKSGEFKDMGGTWRGLTDEEKEYADRVIMENYNLFVQDVAQGRNMTVSEVKDIADGRIYTGVSAKRIGLIDEYGNFYDAIDRAADMGGIEGEPTIYYVNKPSITNLLFGSKVQNDNIAESFVSYYEKSPFGKLAY